MRSGGLVIQFHKSKKSGPFRFTISQRGLSSSVGGGPFRLGMGSNGRIRRTLRIPGTGIYDVKTYGSGRRNSSGSGTTRRGHPFLTLLGLIAVVAVLWTACTSTKGADKSAQSGSDSAQTASVPWANAPKDGTWADAAPTNPVPFGQPTPMPTGGPFTEYQFQISGPPLLTTSDGGKTVTMTSTFSAHRLEDKGFNKTIADSNSFLFRPGQSAPENQTDESHGTHTKVTCQNDRPTNGEITTCQISFTAPASEIQGSYWGMDVWDMGTWPGQV